MYARVYITSCPIEQMQMGLVVKGGEGDIHKLCLLQSEEADELRSLPFHLRSFSNNIIKAGRGGEYSPLFKPGILDSI